MSAARLRWLTLLLVAATVQGCVSANYGYDTDGDGAADSEDCSPADPSISPLAPDPPGDSIDSNCDGVDGLDGDRDGWAAIEGGDCDDSNPAIHPDAEEVCGDGIDDDCSGADLPLDADGDGEPSVACGGTDCLDTAASCLEDCTDGDGDGAPGCVDCADDDPNRRPGAEEACDGADQDCDDASWHPAGEQDSDGDGALACADCDDDDPLRHPEAVEVCDGLDDDCSPATVSPGGEVDADGDAYVGCTGTFVDRSAVNDLGEPILGGGDCDDTDPELRPDREWYLDLDGDGFGTPDASEVSCLPPADHVAEAGDCDDASPDRAPGLAELCDGLDKDCEPTTWPAGGEVDLDQDGWLACSGFVEAGLGLLGGGDCDDQQASERPDGVEECDGLDNDCTGAADEAWDADGDGWGGCAGDCDDADPTVFPGAEDVLGDGLDMDCDGTDVEGLVWARATVGGTGSSVWPGVAILPDLDGDGLPEVAERTNEGLVRVFGGFQLLGGGVLAPTDAIATWEAGASWSIDQGLGVADFDADGVDDLLVQIRTVDNAIAGIPATAVLTGGVLDQAGTLLIEDEPTGANFGRRIEVLSDHDGDGASDLFVVSTAGGTNVCGIAHVFGSDEIQSSFWPLHPMTAQFLVMCDTVFGGLGSSHTEGDFDGDGVLDFAVAGSDIDLSEESAGRLGVFYASSVVVGGVRGVASADAVISGGGEFRQVGHAITSGFDVDGDGLDDMVVTRHDQTSGRDELALFLGNQLGHGSDLSVAAATSWTGLGMDLALGAGITTVPDIDGDGIPDVAVALADSDVGGSGVAWVSTAAMLAAPEALPQRVIVSGVAPVNNQGRSLLRTIGDINGDGVVDLLVFLNQLHLVLGR